MRKIKNLIVLMLCAIIISSFIPKMTSAEEQIYTTNYNDDYIHTIVEDNLTTVVYCLNNDYVWPHTLNNPKQQRIAPISPTEIPSFVVFIMSISFSINLDSAFGAECVFLF